VPAGFTHMTLSRLALDKLEPTSKAKKILKTKIGPYLVGCVGPDIPYMGQFDDSKIKDEFGHIADTLHVDHTIAIPIAGLDLARDFYHSGNKNKSYEFFAFYLGYISHIIGDGFTHPFVRDRVGDYSDATKKAHRELEMKIDVLVLDKYLNIEASGVNPQRDLSLFEDCEYKSEIFQSYSDLLRKFHKQELTGERLEKLADGMRRALKAAQWPMLNWYYLGQQALAYLTLDKVMKEEANVRTLKKAIDAEEKGIAHNSLALHDIDIFNDVFPRYFKHMPKIIDATFKYVFEDGPTFTHLVPEINLDNGRLLADAKDLTKSPALWS
jgi:hypothetical protein